MKTFKNLRDELEEDLGLGKVHLPSNQQVMSINRKLKADAPEVLKEISIFKGNNAKINVRQASLRRIKLFANIIIWISVLAIILSLLGLIPVFKNHDGGIVINQ